jgi:hypothetical protein
MRRACQSSGRDAAPLALEDVMTGPTRRPTAREPSRYSRNWPTMIATVIDTTKFSTDGEATLKAGATPSVSNAPSYLSWVKERVDQGDVDDRAAAVVDHVRDGRTGGIRRGPIGALGAARA